MEHLKCRICGKRIENIEERTCFDCGKFLSFLKQKGFGINFLVRNWDWMRKISSFYDSVPFGKFDGTIIHGKIETFHLGITEKQQ